MKYTGKNHTFVVCAYKESPYIHKCIKSVLRQTVNSKVIIATSTPSEYLSKVAEKYGLKLYINEKEPGIASDWNYAYNLATTELVTIAHQDDVYDRDYLESVLKAANKVKNPILIHTAYYEIRDNKRVYNNKLLNIKKLMLLPLVPSFTWNSIFIRRRSLSLGCAICCPSVTYVKKMLPSEPFEVGCKADLDWQAWEKYSKLKGAFCYVSRPVMGHRVHEGSETSNVIGESNGRTPEDYLMYCKFWPKFIADILIRQYEKGQKSNNLDK